MCSTTTSPATPANQTSLAAPGNTSGEPLSNPLIDADTQTRLRAAARIIATGAIRAALANKRSVGPTAGNTKAVEPDPLSDSDRHEEALVPPNHHAD